MFKQQLKSMNPMQISLSTFILVSASLVLFLFARDDSNLKYQPVGISKIRYDEGLEKCRGRFIDVSDPIPTKRQRNPRSPLRNEPPPKSVFIKNAVLWDGDGKVRRNVDIQLKNGLIAAVSEGNSLQPNENDEIIDANGHIVTPGLVDMHSHAGLDSWPELEGDSDTNEMSESPVRPELRSLDGIDPWDPAFQIINSGGVTTSLILPGSGNMMGGEAYPIKHRFPKSHRAADMLLNAGMNGTDDGHQWRFMKMACGENPINSYGVEKGVLPESRLGEAYLFRKRISIAYEEMLQQDEWCYQAEKRQSTYLDNAHIFMKSPYPASLDQESLIALLRGKILLNVHCYESYDIEMMVRLSKEFGFKIRAFHHALEAWQVADLLAEEGISAAIFSDMWGYKKEAYDSSVKAAQVLTNAGVKVSFKSDHPVLNSQHLIFEAARAHSYGFDASLAIQAVTSIPAERMGQDWRIGYIREGYDADVVIWDKQPLSIGAHPLKVFTDGFNTFTHSDYEVSISKPYDFETPMEHLKQPLSLPKTLANTRTTYVNIGGLVHSPSAIWEPNSKLTVDEKGIVLCIGPACEVTGQVVDLKGSWVIPGMIAAGVHLGIEEISTEPGTSSGVNSETTLRDSYAGLFVGRKRSRELNAAFKAGVTTSISTRHNSGAVIGTSTAFRVGSPRISHDTFVKLQCSNHFRVGVDARNARDPSTSSVNGQLDTIRNNFNHRPPNVHGASDIFWIMSLVENRPPMNRDIVILGGVESHIYASELGQLNASVILNPARCTPNTWHTQECLVPSTSPSAYYKLKENGVNVGLSVQEDNAIRDLIWEAGWQVADLPNYEELTDFEKAKEAASLVTWNIAKAFKIDDQVGTIEVGRRANFVVYNGLPGTLDAKVQLVVDGDLFESDTDQY
ncbi:hypothetical protein HDV02_003499 [Globomyces sp. JEL0801]|nr:hypothetical protein HDV02_003499 [Globomyces sp. JEL0801]